MNDTNASKNKRVFFVGVNTGFVSEGVPDAQFLDFYKSRSSPALYCAIVGNVVVPGGFGTNAQSPVLSAKSEWTTLADAIAGAGSVPGLQLATTWSCYLGQRKFVSGKPSQAIDSARDLLKTITRKAVAESIDKFRVAAQMAVNHGYKHIQIHAAHGYLLSLLLDRELSPLYEHAHEGMASLAEFLRTQKVETSIRWSMRTGDPDFDRRGVLERFEDIVSLNFDFVDLSSGYYNIDKRLIYPATDAFVSLRLEDSLRIARTFPDQNFIVSGKISSFQGRFPENVDLGICRDLIANPQFLKLWTNGCQNRGKCHYYSRGSDRLICPNWAENP